MVDDRLIEPFIVRNSFWKPTAIIGDLPTICQSTVNLQKIAYPAVKPPPDRLFWNFVATATHSIANSANRHVCARKPEEHEVKLVALFHLSFKPGGKAAARQCRFEREVRAPVGKLVEPHQHDPAGLPGRLLRSETGKALGNDVRVDELIDAKRSLQDITRGSGLPRAVWAWRSQPPGVS